MSNVINHPAHYTSGGVECIDAIESALTPEEFRGYCKGNVIKYTFRERMKGGNVDLKKAAWYIDRLTGKTGQNMQIMTHLIAAMLGATVGVIALALLIVGSDGR